VCIDRINGVCFLFLIKIFLDKIFYKIFLFTSMVFYCRWFIVAANLNNHAVVRPWPDVRSRHGGEHSHLTSLDRWQVMVKIWDTVWQCWWVIHNRTYCQIHYSKNTSIGNIATEVPTRNWEFDGKDEYDGGAILSYMVLRKYVQMNKLIADNLL